MGPRVDTDLTEAPSLHKFALEIKSVLQSKIGNFKGRLERVSSFMDFSTHSQISQVEKKLVAILYLLLFATKVGSYLVFCLLKWEGSV